MDSKEPVTYSIDDIEFTKEEAHEILNTCASRGFDLIVNRILAHRYQEPHNMVDDGTICKETYEEFLTVMGAAQTMIDLRSVEKVVKDAMDSQERE